MMTSIGVYTSVAGGRRPKTNRTRKLPPTIPVNQYRELTGSKTVPVAIKRRDVEANKDVLIAI